MAWAAGQAGRVFPAEAMQQLTNRGWDRCTRGAVDCWQESPVATAGGRRRSSEVCLTDRCARLSWLQPVATRRPTGGVAWHLWQRRVGAHCRKQHKNTHAAAVSTLSRQNRSSSSSCLMHGPCMQAVQEVQGQTPCTKSVFAHLWSGARMCRWCCCSISPWTNRPHRDCPQSLADTVQYTCR
jgi:hypothetical protein